MSDTLLKWIAEELLGWRHHPAGPVFPSLEEWTHPDIFETLTFDQLTDYLQSWHGIGLVVEEMERRGWLVRIVRLYSSEFARTVWGVSFVMNSCPEARLETMYHPTFDFILSEAVFAAARKAVEAGKE